MAKIFQIQQKLKYVSFDLVDDVFSSHLLYSALEYDLISSVPTFDFVFWVVDAKIYGGLGEMERSISWMGVGIRFSLMTPIYKIKEVLSWKIKQLL